MILRPTAQLVDGSGSAGALFGGPPLSLGLHRRIRAALSPHGTPLALRTARGDAPPAGFTTTLHGRPVILVNIDITPDLGVTVHLEGPGAPAARLGSDVTGTLTGKGITLAPDAANAVGDPNLQTLLHDPATVAGLLLGRMTASADYQLQTHQPALHRRHERISPHQIGAPHPLAGPLATSAAGFAAMMNASLSWTLSLPWTLSLAMDAHSTRGMPLLPLLHAIYAHMDTVTDRELAVAMVRGGYAGTVEELLNVIDSAARA